MRYSNTLIAVKDMDASLKFYRELFGQEVVTDLDWNKELTCGLSLQKNYERVVGFPAETMTFRSHTMELYFETEDFDGFLALLDSHPEVERMHEPCVYPWLQRGIHIYDPSGHIIEVSESMYSVAARQFYAGKTPEQTAEALAHPQDRVDEWYEQYSNSKSAKNQ